MKFSIITCTYNSENWLAKNIESVNQQTYRNFEHIFIDGNSKDGTMKIISDYSARLPGQVKIFQSEPRGISNAMNEGIAKAEGDYLIHLHSDDSFIDSFVLEGVNTFLDNKNLDWVYGKINVVEENGRSLGMFPTRKIFQQNFKSKFGKYLLKFYNFIPHQAVFIKRDVFERCGHFDVNLSSAMDPDLWLRIRKKTTWKFFDRVVSNYCLRSDSESASIKNKKTNVQNYTKVQKKYLNIIERPMAKIINYFVERKNKNYR